jgi:hypothetical protein
MTLLLISEQVQLLVLQLLVLPLLVLPLLVLPLLVLRLLVLPQVSRQAYCSCNLLSQGQSKKPQKV